MTFAFQGCFSELLKKMEQEGKNLLEYREFELLEKLRL